MKIIMDEDRDILDEIRDEQEQETNRIDDMQTIALIGGQWGLFFGLSYFNNPATQMQGLLIFVGSLLAMAFVWAYPSYMAALRAGSRIYLDATIYHGSFFSRKQLEIIDAPKVVARELEDGTVEILDNDEDYEALFNAMEIRNVTDSDIDNQIRDAYEKRYKKLIVKEENKERGYAWVIRKLRRRKKNDDKN